MNWFLSEFNIRAWRLIRSYRLEAAPNVALIYGPRGIGKSTMLRSLYQHNRLNEESIFTDALSFSRQYAYAAQDNKLKLFRQRYRSTRLLLIDDLQFFEGKVKTIEELHYTYEYVIGNGGKMVISLEADLPQLEFLGERLASRFLSGVVVPVNRPLEHEMERFLEEYIHQKHLFMDKLVVGVIAGLTDNLADAMRVIEQFIQFAELEEDELSLQCFQVFWDKEEEKRKMVADPMNIINIVSQNTKVSVEELVGPSRKTNVNEARQLAIYTIRTLCQISFPLIGCYFNRKHSTMITSYQKIQAKLASDQELYKKYEIILKSFKA
ncbi:DnaA/Hda family protein [Desulfosporosinus sp. BG]|uniref:DnaA/Hda family protein n=1 Tax=Desulfosporosinus sp. BG TaxID=1633135 RepID=UPI000839F876|nr:DnaA/Hda family protein [Desulfosporosinus sp. BG]ODA40559.1 Chromosomal replication initiator protein DnaA [Desulfosporosinus sp. BG]